MKVIFPNAYYVDDKKKVVDTLFNSGGTALGYYKQRKGGIMFYDMQDKPFLFLVSNKYNEKFFVSCYCFEGKIYYMFALSSNTEKLLGIDKLKYSEGIKLAEDIYKQITG